MPLGVQVDAALRTHADGVKPFGVDFNPVAGLDLDFFLVNLDFHMPLEHVQRHVVGMVMHMVAKMGFVSPQVHMLISALGVMLNQFSFALVHMGMVVFGWVCVNVAAATGRSRRPVKRLPEYQPSNAFSRAGCQQQTT